MYRPRENNFIYLFFSWYISTIIKKHFATVQLTHVDVRSDASVLLIANHFSWWDGFLLFQLNKRLFKKKFHILVNTENYRRIKFLRHLGAFAPEHHGKDLIETLNYAGRLLDDPQNLVVIFPQGKLYSNHLKEIGFERGVEYIIKGSRRAVDVIFSATFIDYFSKKKPVVYTYLKHFENEAKIDMLALKNSYNKHYEESLVKQTQLRE